MSLTCSGVTDRQQHWLLSEAAGSYGNDCADSASAQAEDAIGPRLNVSCTHQNGDRYVCEVTGGNLAWGIQTGSYSTMYDGRSITYQPSQ